jgi:aerobic-type carbon monoxide dehydrogenase small subunit (CoxS/CutS family)
VNNHDVELDVAPSTPLLWALRDELGHRGAKYGCGLEQCGACRVLIDGVPQPSCRVSVEDLAGHTVTTIEQLATEPAGRRVIDALVARNAGQCGYCLPGIVITLTALVERGASIERREIVTALDPHLCRCGAQPRIIAAAMDLLCGSDGGA